MRRAWAIPTGSLVLGLTAYGFLILTARSLEPAAYAPLAALWALVFAVAPALFLPLEQEVTRLLARDDDDAPAVSTVLRAAAACASVGVLLAVLIGLPAAGALRERAFDGSRLLLAGLVLSLFGFALMHMIRGVMLGTGNHAAYGFSMAGEGLLRLGCVAGLALAAVTSAGPYGLVLGAAPLLMAAALLPAARARARDLHRSPQAPQVTTSSMLRSMSLLVVASVLSLSLINAGPVAVKLLARPDEAGQAGRLLAGLVLARLPLFAFPTLQGALLPRFTRLATVSDRAGLVELIRRVVGLHMAATMLAAGFAALVGPFALEVAFGAAYRLRGGDLALLTVGAAGHLLAMLLGLVLVAEGRSRSLALSWVVAVAAAGLTLMSVQPLLLRVELALLVGAWTAVASVAVALARTGSSSPARTTTRMRRSAP